jgi:hypothetical protein
VCVWVTMYSYSNVSCVFWSHAWRRCLWSNPHTEQVCQGTELPKSSMALREEMDLWLSQWESTLGLPCMIDGEDSNTVDCNPNTVSVSTHSNASDGPTGPIRSNNRIISQSRSGQDRLVDDNWWREQDSTARGRHLRLHRILDHVSFHHTPGMLNWT